METLIRYIIKNDQDEILRIFLTDQHIITNRTIINKCLRMARTSHKNKIIGIIVDALNGCNVE